MRTQYTVLAVLVLLGISFTGYQFFTFSKSKPRVQLSPNPDQQHILSKAAALLHEDTPIQNQKALELLTQYPDPSFWEQDDELQKQWVELYTLAAIRSQETSSLTMLFERYPDTLKDNERAALVVAKALLDQDLLSDYLSLRLEWEGKEKRPHQWLFLDAQSLQNQVRLSEAKQLLESVEYSGTRESERLIMLGKISLQTDPVQAWHYLTEAGRINENDPYLRTLRGRLLEQIGKVDLARAEYLAAAARNPDDLAIKNSLAEFYLRQADHERALATWITAVKTHPSDATWVKAKFWSLMINREPFEKSSLHLLGEKSRRPVVQNLSHLPKEQFWNKSLVQDTENIDQVMPQDQALFWLQLVQYIKDGEEAKAEEFLAARPYQGKSWAPELESALATIFTYRNTEELTPLQLTTTVEPAHIFFRSIQQAANHSFDQPQTRQELSSPLQALLKSDEAFTAAFLAAGWKEAALATNRHATLSEDLPTWIAYNLTQAYQSNRGAEQALHFASQQKPFPALDVLKAEILLSLGKEQEGIQQLQRFAFTQNPVGLRAAWLLSQAYIERKEYRAAKQVVEENPSLQESLVGTEILAKIAHLEGNVPLAARLYSQIENESSEAQSYLAKQAFQSGDLQRAKDLTEKLLIQHPNDITVRKNLKMILEKISHEQ